MLSLYYQLDLKKIPMIILDNIYLICMKKLQTFNHLEIEKQTFLKLIKEMNFSNIFLSKFPQKGTIQGQSGSKSYSIFHNLIVNSTQYCGRQSLRKNKFTKEYQEKKGHTNPKTSLYLCKRILLNQDLQNLQTCVIKRLAYRKVSKANDQGKTIYNDHQSKNYDQISTEYHSYQLMKDSHRAIQMKDFIHQNIKSKEDIKFFYNFLKLNDRRSQGIKNICFVLEQMNEGSLTQQIRSSIQKKKEPFSEQKIMQLTCQIAQGLIQLRSKGIIHRDLRPDNILIHNGQIKFSDFDSAFISGFSDWRNIKNGVQMKDTTPLEIMLLVSETEERLEKFSNKQLFQQQQNADIYFLGINIYSMIFMQSFQTFNGGMRLNNLIKMKKRSGFCPQLLDLMEKCLQKKPQVRIQLDEVVKILSELQVKFYISSSSYKRVYLCPQPLNLYSFSSNQIQQKLKSQESSIQVQEKMINREAMNKTFQQTIKASIVQRNTQIYQNIGVQFMNKEQNFEIWYDNAKSQQFSQNKKQIRDLSEKYLQKLQIKAYYYELAFRILCEINLDSIKSFIYLFNINSHLSLYLHELSIVLTVLYDLIMRCSFTEDPLYEAGNIGYENKQVKDNMRNLYSRRQFFAGRKQIVGQSYKNIESMNCHLQLIKKSSYAQYEAQIRFAEQKISFFIKYKERIAFLQGKIASIKQIRYNENNILSFVYEYNQHQIILAQIQSIAKKEMVQTIISLIIAYEQLKLQPQAHRSNLKNAIFMLMILQIQEIDKLQKNDIVIIKNELTTMVNLKLGWKSQQLQSFFNNFTEIHNKQLVQGLQELPSQAIIEAETIKEKKKTLTFLDSPVEIQHTQHQEQASSLHQTTPPQIKIIQCQQINKEIVEDHVFESIEDSVIQHQTSKEGRPESKRISIVNVFDLEQSEDFK